MWSCRHCIPADNLKSEDENVWSENEENADILSSADSALLAAIEEDSLFLSQGIDGSVQ